MPKVSGTVIRFIAIATIAIIAAVARADTFTFSPDPVNLDDLDHHSLYTWRIRSTADWSNVQIVEARLTIKNIRDWTENEPNVLHLHLLDNALNRGVASFIDDNPGDDHVTDLTDDFSNTRYHHGKDATGANSPWLVGTGTADTFLANPSFTAIGSDYTYDFVANNTSSILLSYLQNDGRIALGLDPDCHLLNDGVTLTIKTTKGSVVTGAVPEPGTLALLGAGLLPFAGAIRRRRR